MIKSVNYLIVEIEQNYNNEVGGIIVNSTIESVANINRVATVVTAPYFTILKEGDKVIIHHNILRLRNSTKGNVVQSDYHIEGNKFFVPLTEVFMYQRDGEWKSIDPYCFVRPIERGVSEGFYDSENSYKGMTHNVGVMVYPNKALIEQGVKAGDVVMFSRNSEYEFEVEGELLYKMGTRDILSIIE